MTEEELVNTIRAYAKRVRGEGRTILLNHAIPLVKITTPTAEHIYSGNEATAILIEMEILRAGLPVSLEDFILFQSKGWKL